MYTTHLAESKEASSSLFTTKCVTKSYTSLDDPSLQPLYAVNLSSTRAAVDHRGVYVKRVKYWIHGVTY